MDIIIISIISLSCTILGAILGVKAAINSSKKSIKEETKEETKCNIRLETKIDYATRGIDDIKLDNKEQMRQISSLNDRVIRTEESLKSVHKRIDTLEEKEVMRNGLN